MNEELFGPIDIQALPPLCVAAYRAVSATPEDDAIRVMSEWIARQGWTGPRRQFGFDCEVAPEQQRAGLRGYEVWSTIPADAAPCEGVTIGEFPGGLYATMLITDPFVDPFARIPAGWQRLHEWVAASSYYRMGSHQCLEEVIEHDGRQDMVIYYAITPALEAVPG